MIMKPMIIDVKKWLVEGEDYFPVDL